MVVMTGRRTFLQGSIGLAGAAALDLAGLRQSVAQAQSFTQAQSANLVPATGAYSAPGLAYASLFLADRKKLWAANGLAPTLKQVEGGSLAMVTLNSGESEFVGVASTDAMIAWERGVRMLVVAAFYGSLTIQLTAGREWMEKSGIGPNASIEDRVRALKGVRIGSSSLGGGPPQYTKFLGSLYGLDPERDIRITMVGQGPTRIAALREGRVDMVVGGAPEADQIALDGYGSLYINFPEVPLFKEFPFTVVAVKQEIADKDPDRVRRIAQTIGQANDIIRNDFPVAVAEMQAQFPRINPQAIERAMMRDRSSVPASGRMTETMWANGYKCAAAMKSIKATPPLEEGSFWTNKFLA
jgi:NitT/TauT family transport system substrate-binding protein